MPKIGILAIQGDVQEHTLVLNQIGIEVVEVRLPDELDDLDDVPHISQGFSVVIGDSGDLTDDAIFKHIDPDCGSREMAEEISEERDFWFHQNIGDKNTVFQVEI